MRPITSYHESLRGPVTRDEWPLLLACALVILWAGVDILRSYPGHFFPRFWDEAIYASDALLPGAMLGEYRPDVMRYGPAKLGYGFPLSLAVSAFGADGAMYFSTACWLITIVLLGWMTLRLFGLSAAAIACAFLAFSPLFGKYIAEAGPTLLAGVAFVSLWAVHRRQWFWLSGLVVGLIAFIDFKWAVPAGLALIVDELFVERRLTLKNRLIFIVLAGATALIPIVIAAFVHPPFADYLRSYVTGHAELVGFEPSAIFLYYLLLFGAAPAFVMSAAVIALPQFRRALTGNRDGPQAFWSAVVFFAVPILFYSFFGQLKALRFFAVTFPLVAVPIGLALSLASRWLLERVGSGGHVRALVSCAAALLISASIVPGSDGPARHLRYPTGFESALSRLRANYPKDGTVSSFLWPVVHYGWRVPIRNTPFLMWGFTDSDKWMIIDSTIDRITTEMRMRMAMDTSKPYDSGWALVRSRVMEASTPLFSVTNDFYASDYFLSENVVGGIPVLRRWRSFRTDGHNDLEVRLLDMEKSRALRMPRIKRAP